MSYGNYGQRRQPKPRPVLPEEHALSPRAEGVIASKQQLSKDYNRPGGESSRETILFEKDPERQSLPVPNAAMFIRMQSGVPLDHPNHPEIKKFAAEFPSSDYHFVYTGPLVWMHDANFRHIPCYTRYVIDKHGRVLNAYNGKPVEPEKGGYSYKLVSDGPVNNPYFAQKEKLMILAWCPLPEGFVDYGMNNYSHVLDVDVEAGTHGWVARPQVKARNNETGRTETYMNLLDLMQCACKDFQLKADFRPYVRDGLKGECINIGPFSIKEVVPSEQPGPLPTIQPGGAPAAAAEPTSMSQAIEEPAPTSGYDAFDDDINF